MRIFATRKPRDFRLRDKRTYERHFDFHKPNSTGRQVSSILSLVVLLVLLLAVWYLIN